VVAEAGSNHNQDIEVAMRLVDVAVEAGADAIKFQTYSGERIYSRKAESTSLRRWTTQTPAEFLDALALPRAWHAELAAYARSRGIDFFSSPFDHDAVALLAEVGAPILKIASGEIVDLPLIGAAAATGLPLVISTGMATLGEIEEALSAAEHGGAVAVALLHCISLYPSPVEQMNLRAMKRLRSAFGVPVGLSDHSTGITVAIAAAALGAAIIEKHITLDHSMPGPDHSFALEPGELAAMVRGIRDAEAALGDGVKAGPNAGELEENYTLARRSLIAARDLAAGTVLEAAMLTIKRPGYGIAPKHLGIVLGRTLRTDVEADDVLTWEML
jgi:sialic acid synthase SpsE